MNRQQFLLCKLAEEAAEVAHMAMKCQQFGLKEVYPKAGIENRDRLLSEIHDLLTVVDLLTAESDFHFYTDSGAGELKRQKMAKYYKYSQELGEVDGVQD